MPEWVVSSGAQGEFAGVVPARYRRGRATGRTDDNLYNEIGMAISHDGGVSWTTKTVVPPGASLGHVWLGDAVDADGTSRSPRTQPATPSSRGPPIPTASAPGWPARAEVPNDSVVSARDLAQPIVRSVEAALPSLV